MVETTGTPASGKPTLAAGAPLAGIEHIVVVMFENRSFDNVLGRLYPPSDSFDGLPLTASNSYENDLGETITVPVTNDPPSGRSPFITPYPDPHEGYDDMTKQLFGYHGSPIADMSGFAQNYHAVDPLSRRHPGDIMFYFTPDQMPVTNHLAQQYAVCDQWFASGPVQTFPNRMFCHCGTPSLDGNKSRINDIDYIVHASHTMKAVAGSVTDTSVFELLDRAGHPWKIYFHDAPMSILNAYVNDAFEQDSPCIANYDRSDYDPPRGTGFASDVANDALPAYAFIEPRYYDNYASTGLQPDSNHPGGAAYPDIGTGQPIDVRNGEALLLDIYNSLAAHPEVFAKTLLIVTYDEHGGLYDHVGPNTLPFAATAVSPFQVQPENFDYTRLGVRVPTLFVNPRIPANTIYRPLRPSRNQPYYPFDHTSIIATLCAQFGLNGPLTPRDAVAPILSGLIPPGPDAVAAADPARLTVLKQWVAATPSPPGSPAGPMTSAEHDRLLAAQVRAKAGS
jgi:phospholipase C